MSLPCRVRDTTDMLLACSTATSSFAKSAADILAIRHIFAFHVSLTAYDRFVFFCRIVQKGVLGYVHTACTSQHTICEHHDHTYQHYSIAYVPLARPGNITLVANVLVSYAWTDRILPSRLKWVSIKGGGLFAYVFDSRSLLRSVQILLFLLFHFLLFLAS